ncbi:7-carboxy-7-deazaguanine synthase [Desulfovibrio desulfuricans]|uniref:7-carboxy-7-deazaguanine synthase n=1 Tax=bioreactor metagenome TaxID=1076179 RepID=A0A644SRJ9_9ZZZZ|nr:7-carboxy-7-deazaguanine synthase [Desulfovibrio desulfuricans]MBT9749032.1 7-carboxy-7-deazaguanine synthase [Desulfovibrio desulfuricans]MEA4989720.1 7-carboxy-7-deazaguanine synthase [Desulfovibrio desulfuricans]
MSFAVKEIFYTLQGEGFHAGRPAVFCRFSGCNLWSGQEEDRKFAKCPFCDTDFLGAEKSGGEFKNAATLAQAICSFFPSYTHPGYRPYVVFTGGEPALQLTEELLQELGRCGVETGIETNGTLPLPKGLDWITVSPKAGTKLVVTSGSELKLVWPQEGISVQDFEQLDFKHFFLQPRDYAGQSQATEDAVRICQDRPLWKLSLQTHKFIGIA